MSVQSDLKINKGKVPVTGDDTIEKANSVLEQKRKILEDTLMRIEKQHGKGSIMTLGSGTSAAEGVESISTGSLLLDEAIGIGGVPRGRIVEIYGPEASGKTTITLQIIAEAQKNGIAAFIDAEHALDVAYARNLGVKPEELVLSQPDYGEQALDIVEMLVRSNAVDVIVVDSVAALVPKSELEGDMGDSHMGLQARLMSQALRKLTALVHKSKTCLIFINQVRQNIGAMAFGPKETTTGGNALKFYASLRMDIRRVESLKDKEGKHYGNKIVIKIVKNKVGIPFKNINASMIFGAGVSRYFEALDIGLSLGIIEQHGAWFYKDGTKICQGKDALIDLLKKDKLLFNGLVDKIKSIKKDLGIVVDDKEQKESKESTVGDI